MAVVEAGGSIRVELVQALGPHRIERVTLTLPGGASVDDALRAAGWLARVDDASASGTAARVGIWGKVCERQALLREGDRVELYRPLAVDPKEARRQRYRRDGARRAPGAGAPGRPGRTD